MFSQIISYPHSFIHPYTYRYLLNPIVPPPPPSPHPPSLELIYPLPPSSPILLLSQVSFEAWDRFYDTRQRKVKVITGDKELAKYHPHLAVYCNVERVGSNPHTADYRLHNLIHVADAIRDYFQNK